MNQAVAQTVFSEQPAVNQATTPTEFSFPRDARLLTAGDYAQVFKKNKRFSDRYWTVLVHRSDNIQPRLGLAIAKKRAKRAVDRNKLKRIARESFRHQMAILAHYDLVVMNRDAAANASHSELRAAMDGIFRKVQAAHRQGVK